VIVERKHFRACIWLIATTVLWGLSFPLIKAILMKQEQLLPAARSAFFASMIAVVRFGVAAVFAALFCARTLRQCTRSELWQGGGLAVFGGFGIILQMDGLAHTSASVSAFLTQFTALLIPIWVACTRRALPPLAVVISSILVLAGAGILAKFDWHEFRIGRGEAETLLAAIFFAGQILWLERPGFARNRTIHFTVIMFAGTSMLALPVALLYAPQASALIKAYADGSVLWMTAGLVLFCTLTAYGLMNVWQRHISATEAGLIYCIEPIAASAFALFLPQWLSRAAGVNYANEHITRELLLGGGLILAANVLIQFEAAQRARRSRACESERPESFSGPSRPSSLDPRPPIC
jgi:drug/metabolite transporter (DMT)-like permease